jgi:Putative zinc-finger
MTFMTCKDALASLEAYFDEELPVSDQIALRAHVDECAGCSAAFKELEGLRAELRHVGIGHLALNVDEVEGFEAVVVKRAEVEAGASFTSWVRGLFDDMHFVYAGLSATVATLVCATITFGMFRFATTAEPDSLGALVGVLSTPGSNENPLHVYGRIQLPRVLDPAESGSANDADAVFALAAVVTREGTISSLELLHAHGGPWLGDAGRIESVINAVSRARFEPAQSDDGPVALNMVWVVANTTVRPEEQAKHTVAPAKTADDASTRTPAAKKRIARARDSRPSAVA